MHKPHTPRCGGPRRGGAVGPLAAGLLLVALGLRAAPLFAQVPLACGVPQLHTLEPDGVDVYSLTIPDDGTAILQATSLSNELGKVRLQLSGPDGPTIDTCSGVIELRNRSGDFTLQVSQCNGTSGGDYTVTLNIASENDGNCGRPLQCGATPPGVGFNVPGEVDSFRFELDPGEHGVRLKLNYLDPPMGNESESPYLVVFDPHGNKIVPGTCPRADDWVDIPQPVIGGTYTALVSTCIGTRLRDYRMELYRQSSCALGPTITHFGVSSGHGDEVQPIGFDDSGRPIFVQQLGYGLLLVVEARIGPSTRPVGNYTVSYEEGGTEKDPDMQMILSQPLGDGDPRICDIFDPNFGGVPATVPFDFEDDAHDAIADMGCRFDDGSGRHIGRRDPLNACTFTNQLFGYSFVDTTSYIQYCSGPGPIDVHWAFPLGDTVVRARVKDIRGNFGEPRDIIVRISGVSTPTPIETDTPPPDTPTPMDDLTATPTPGAGCVGDCNGDQSVAIDELITSLLIALGNDPLAVCPAADADGDGMVIVNDLVQAVNSSLNGCFP